MEVPANGRLALAKTNDAPVACLKLLVRFWSALALRASRSLKA